jgi:lactate permease
MNEVWYQSVNPVGKYLGVPDPFGMILSVVAAAIPVCTLFYFLAVRRTVAWRSAVYSFIAALVVALVVFRMPAYMTAGAVAHGAVYGWFRIAWIMVASVYVYDLSVESGQFEVIKKSISGLSNDRRLQLLLIAFAFGSLLEGAGGGGAPVAVCGAMMIGLGFPPMQTALICLIGNSAPVAFGGLGNPVRTLVAVTGLPEADFSAMLGRILPLTVLVLPFWLVRMMCKGRDTMKVWPGLLAGGIACGGIQFFWANYMGPTLASVVAGIGTLLVMAVFFKFWRPGEVWRYPGEAPVKIVTASERLGAVKILMAWMPFVLLTVSVVIWGLAPVVKQLDTVSFRQPVPGLHNMTVRMPPVTLAPQPQAAVFDGSWLSTPGTGVFFAGLIAGPLAGLSFKKTLQVFVRCLHKLRLSIVAIMCMLGVGYVIRYCGMDATLGMAMAETGKLFPFFGTMIGWLGVALSGTDAGSNALFGSFQVVTANKLGLSPILMGAANSAGGVMGKMIAAQSLVIAAAVTGQEGQEGLIFRKVLVHSLALAVLVGLIVCMYAYVFPGAIPSGHHYL